ncbi:MAG: hypothetical protein CL880_00495 [Dehalococcoidia bacterium]|nr:hypothetical protein [Dehalococcoidia bacterium]
MTEGQNARKEEGKPKKRKEQKPYGGKDLGLRFKDKGRDLKETVAYKNGEWMPKSQVTIELGDRGFYLGDAVFDLFRTFDGRPFRIKDHIDRFFRSAQFARLDPGFTPDELTALTLECVERNEQLRSEFGDWSVWFSVTRGLAGWRTLDAKPTFVVYAGEVPFYTFADQYADGASAVITRSRNHTHQSLDPKVKHTSRMHLNLSDLEARDVDPTAWPIMLDMEGNIAEGSGSNVFVVSGSSIKTPSDATILRGVTRDVVIELSDQLGIPLSEEAIQPYDVYTADEVFFTSTPFSVLPVTSVDRREIGDGRPGPIATRLLAAFSELAGIDIVDQAQRYKDARSDN